MSAKRRRLSKKEYERLERARAEEKAKARSDSEKRQERIKKIWNSITSGKLSPRGDESENVARDLKSEIEDEVFAEWTTVKKGESEKGLRRRDREDTHQRRSSNELYLSLVELVRLQKLEIEYLTQFRRDWEEIHAHCPEQLENLSSVSFRAAWEPLFEKLLAEKKRKEAWEYQRRRGYKLPGGVGLIEYEFGGAAEAERRKPLSPLYGLPYEPTCLDDIFAGGAVRMRSEDIALNPQSSSPVAWWLPKAQHRVGLEELFGMERHRFGKGLSPIEKGRERWYDYRAVVKIMHRLLNEEPRKGKRPRRGKTRRLWLGDREEMHVLGGIVARRVLTRIIARMRSLAVSEDIWDAFTAVVCFHISRGIEGRLSEDVKNWLAALVRRYLA